MRVNWGDVIPASVWAAVAVSVFWCRCWHLGLLAHHLNWGGLRTDIGLATHCMEEKMSDLTNNFISVFFFSLWQLSWGRSLNTTQKVAKYKAWLHSHLNEPSAAESTKSDSHGIAWLVPWRFMMSCKKSGCRLRHKRWPSLPKISLPSTKWSEILQ